jgi:hypothetical protein
MEYLLIKSFVRIFCIKKRTLKLIFKKAFLVVSWISDVSRDVLVVLKQLSIIEPKRQQSIIGIHSYQWGVKKERSMGEKLPRIEYETDQISRESDLTTQNRI